MKTLWIAAALLLAGTLAGCGSGSDNDSAFDQTTSVTAAIAAATHAQAAQISAIQSKQTADENTIASIALFGHVPGVTTTAEETGSVRTNAVSVVDNTDYGICQNIGQHVGPGIRDADGSSTDVFKQCTGVKYAVNSNNGNIATAPVIWFTDSTCGASGGTAFEMPSVVGYDRPTLDGGYVFKSQKDGTVFWVQENTSGVVPADMVAQSNYFQGVCQSDPNDTGPGYLLVQNVTDGSQGSGIPDAGVPATYVYN